MSSALAPLELDLANAVIRERLAEAARDALADQLRRTHSASPVAGTSSPSASAASRRGLPLPLQPTLTVDLSAPLPRPADLSAPRPWAATVAVRHWLASGLLSLAARLDPSASVADASLVVLKAR